MNNQPQTTPPTHDPAAETAEPGFYWVDVIGTNLPNWQTAECYRTGHWSLLGMPRFSIHSYADMIRAVGPKLSLPEAAR